MNEFGFGESETKVEYAGFELQTVYLCSCRLLQWMAERLPIDRRSSAMRGMDLQDWYKACDLLISIGIINSQLMLQRQIADALPELRQFLKNALEDELTTQRERKVEAYACMASSCDSSIVTASKTVA